MKKIYVAFRQKMGSVDRGVYEDEAVYLPTAQGRLAILRQTGATGDRKLAVPAEQVFSTKKAAMHYMSEGIKGFVVVRGDDWKAPRLVEVSYYVEASGSLHVVSEEGQEIFRYRLGRPKDTSKEALELYLKHHKFSLKSYVVAIKSAQAAFEEAKKFEAVLKKNGVRT